ncbi:MAG: Maf family protein [Christensenellales bacterium]
MRRLILASSSPRRQELLAMMGLNFDVFSPQVDECLRGSPREVVMALALRKASVAAAAFPADFVLAADTLVVIDGQALGKPADYADALRMLRLLNGAWHEVHTGVCLIVDGRIQQEHAVTQVLFTRMSEDEMAGYCRSGEPLGKAGAYAIQGLGGMFIEQICGSYTNVVGLPTALVRRMLKSENFL